MIGSVSRTTTIVVLCFAAAVSAGAQNCTNADFKGIYSALVTGSFITPPEGVPAGATARVGRVSVDGAGVSNIIATLSLLGFIFQENYGGNYVINSDCSADVTLNVLFPNSPTPVPFHFLGSLAESGNSMNLLLADPQGTDLRIALRRLQKTSCSVQDLKGTYALSLAGPTFMVPLNPSGAFARVGQVKFDGAGLFTGSVHTSYNGVVLAETLSGAYTVDSSCIFHTTYTQYGVASSWTGVLYGSGTPSPGASILVSAPEGSVVTGTMNAITTPATTSREPLPTRLPAWLQQ